MSEIWISGHFLEDCFYSYSQQIISAIANESLFSDKNLKNIFVPHKYKQ